MFRKVTIALAAIATIGAAALVPTTASAGWKGHYGHSWGYKSYYNTGYYGHGYGYGYNCWVKKWVYTPYGAVLKRIYVCY